MFKTPQTVGLTEQVTPVQHHRDQEDRHLKNHQCRLQCLLSDFRQYRPIHLKHIRRISFSACTCRLALTSSPIPWSLFIENHITCHQQLVLHSIIDSIGFRARLISQKDNPNRPVSQLAGPWTNYFGISSTSKSP